MAQDEPQERDAPPRRAADSQTGDTAADPAKDDAAPGAADEQDGGGVTSAPQLSPRQQPQGTRPTSTSFNSTGGRGVRLQSPTFGLSRMPFVGGRGGGGGVGMMSSGGGGSVSDGGNRPGGTYSPSSSSFDGSVVSFTTPSVAFSNPFAGWGPPPPQRMPQPSKGGATHSPHAMFPGVSAPPPHFGFARQGPPLPMHLHQSLLPGRPNVDLAGGLARRPMGGGEQLQQHQPPRYLPPTSRPAAGGAPMPWSQQPPPQPAQPPPPRLMQQLPRAPPFPAQQQEAKANAQPSRPTSQAAGQHDLASKPPQHATSGPLGGGGGGAARAAQPSAKDDRQRAEKDSGAPPATDEKRTEDGPPGEQKTGSGAQEAGETLFQTRSRLTAFEANGQQNKGWGPLTLEKDSGGARLVHVPESSPEDVTRVELRGATSFSRVKEKSFRVSTSNSTFVIQQPTIDVGDQFYNATSTLLDEIRAREEPKKQPERPHRGSAEGEVEPPIPAAAGAAHYAQSKAAEPSEPISSQTSAKEGRPLETSEAAPAAVVDPKAAAEAKRQREKELLMKRIKMLEMRKKMQQGRGGAAGGGTAAAAASSESAPSEVAAPPSKQPPPSATTPAAAKAVGTAENDVLPTASAPPPSSSPAASTDPSLAVRTAQPNINAPSAASATAPTATFSDPSPPSSSAAAASDPTPSPASGVASTDAAAPSLSAPDNAQRPSFVGWATPQTEASGASTATATSTATMPAPSNSLPSRSAAGTTPPAQPVNLCQGGSAPTAAAASAAPMAAVTAEAPRGPPPASESVPSTTSAGSIALTAQSTAGATPTRPSMKLNASAAPFLPKSTATAPPSTEAVSAANDEQPAPPAAPTPSNLGSASATTPAAEKLLGSAPALASSTKPAEGATGAVAGGRTFSLRSMSPASLPPAKRTGVVSLIGSKPLSTAAPTATKPAEDGAAPVASPNSGEGATKEDETAGAPLSGTKGGRGKKKQLAKARAQAALRQQQEQQHQQQQQQQPSVQQLQPATPAQPVKPATQQSQPQSPKQQSQPQIPTQPPQNALLLGAQQAKIGAPASAGQSQEAATRPAGVSLSDIVVLSGASAPQRPTPTTPLNAVTNKPRIGETPLSAVATPPTAAQQSSSPSSTKAAQEPVPGKVVLNARAPPGPPPQRTAAEEVRAAAALRVQPGTAAPPASASQNATAPPPQIVRGVVQLKPAAATAAPRAQGTAVEAQPKPKTVTFGKVKGSPSETLSAADAAASSAVVAPLATRDQSAAVAAAVAAAAAEAEGKRSEARAQTLHEVRVAVEREKLALKRKLEEDSARHRGRVKRKAAAWSQQNLFQRLQTFRTRLWPLKPAAIGAAECARHGWLNVAYNTLGSEDSDASIVFDDLAASYEAEVERVRSLMVGRGHGLLSGWVGRVCDPSLLSVPGEFVSAASVNARAQSIRALRLSVRPSASCVAEIEPALLRSLRECIPGDEWDSALVALFGWTPRFRTEDSSVSWTRLMCDLCGAEVAASNAEQLDAHDEHYAHCPVGSERAWRRAAAVLVESRARRDSVAAVAGADAPKALTAQPLGGVEDVSAGTKRRRDHDEAGAEEHVAVVKADLENDAISSTAAQRDRVGGADDAAAEQAETTIIVESPTDESAPNAESKEEADVQSTGEAAVSVELVYADAAVDSEVPRSESKPQDIGGSGEADRPVATPDEAALNAGADEPDKSRRSAEADDEAK